MNDNIFIYTIINRALVLLPCGDDDSFNFIHEMLQFDICDTWPNHNLKYIQHFNCLLLLLVTILKFETNDNEFLISIAKFPLWLENSRIKTDPVWNKLAMVICENNNSIS